MEHSTPGDGFAIAQTLLFLGATCVVVPGLKLLRMSSVMGFLIIGAAMGPHVLGQLASQYPWLSAFELENAEPTLLLGELGVIFLLFIIGLEVSFERLWALRRYVFGLGLAQVTITAVVIGASRSHSATPSPWPLCSASPSRFHPRRSFCSYCASAAKSRRPSDGQASRCCCCKI